jgi:hypothetical protein
MRQAAGALSSIRHLHAPFAAPFEEKFKKFYTPAMSLACIADPRRRFKLDYVEGLCGVVTTADAYAKLMEMIKHHPQQTQRDIKAEYNDLCGGTHAGGSGMLAKNVYDFDGNEFDAMKLADADSMSGVAPTAPPLATSPRARRSSANHARWHRRLAAAALGALLPACSCSSFPPH